MFKGVVENYLKRGNAFRVVVLNFDGGFFRQL